MSLEVRIMELQVFGLVTGDSYPRIWSSVERAMSYVERLVRDQTPFEFRALTDKITWTKDGLAMKPQLWRHGDLLMDFGYRVWVVPLSDVNLYESS